MKIVLLLIAALLGTIACTNRIGQNIPLRAPEGFGVALSFNQQQEKSYKCGDYPPFTSALAFPSKYEGSGRSRDVFNPKAAAIYTEKTKPIYDFSKYVAKLSDQLYANEGSFNDYRCLITLLSSWAESGALLDKTDDSRGKAARKWTLAAVSSNYLKLSSLHANDIKLKKERRAINTWLDSMSKLVILDYSNRPIERVNNHDYWAAWAVMVTSVILNDEEKFDWASEVYKVAMYQINEQGFWPNEVRRATRAREYHNFAMAPVVAMASLLAVNGKSDKIIAPKKLEAVAQNIFFSIEDSSQFESLTGIEQNHFDLTTSGRLAWLPMYIYVTQNKDARRIMLDYPSKGNSRLGGDVRSLYLQD